MFKKGDRVKLKDCEGVTGEVVDTRCIGSFGVDIYEYRVLHDDIKLIPPAWFPEYCLLPIDSPKRIIVESKCECGQKFNRHGGKHSTWCKLYKGD